VQVVEQAHLAQGVIVFIEGAAVQSHGDLAAAFQHLGHRRDAGAQAQVGTGVDRD
jgi:hypothetical protein